MKEYTRCKFGLFFILLGLLTACSTYHSGKRKISNHHYDTKVTGRFALSQQIAPPSDIQSVQLYAGANKTAPPIIKINSSSSLTLEFDNIATKNRQFKLSVSHREKNWKESGLAPNDYLNGFFETTFGGGEKSFSENPTYFHYSYSFPNRQLDINQSGNYLLSVYDYHSNTLLFRIPFFISENRGILKTHIESLFAQRNDGRTLAQPFSVYEYPDFVGQPQFNLSFYYVQNQFWGRARTINFFDTSSPGEIHFHLGRDQSFIGDYEINALEMRSFRPDGRQIIDLKPGQTPPLVTLRRDVQQFNTILSQYPGQLKGPRNEREAQYGDILFSLETNKDISPADAIYLTGDFNNWIIDRQFRMNYDSTANLWKQRAIIKQGSYAYKYVLLDDNKINDLALDQGLTNSTQSYLTFIYFQDPDQHFDRLLQVNRIRSK